MMADINKIQTEVFTRIINDSQIKALQEKYAGFELTTSAVSSKEPTFPTLLLQALESPEIGQDLNNKTINGIYAGFQIDVTDNEKNRTRVNEIIPVVKRIMKSMSFNLRDAPPMDTSNEKRSTFTATRIIGNGETF